MDRALKDFRSDVEVQAPAIHAAAVQRLLQQAQRVQRKPNTSVLDVLPVHTLLIGQHTVRPCLVLCLILFLDLVFTKFSYKWHQPVYHTTKIRLQDRQALCRQLWEQLLRAC